MGDVTDQLELILAEQRAALSTVEDSHLEALAKAIQGANRIFLTGKGRTALQLRGFAMRLMHLGFQVHMVDDVTTPAIEPGDLLLIGSGSGHTPTPVRHASRAREVGADTLLITAANDSPAHTYARQVIYLNATTPKIAGSDPSRSILQMGTLFEQCLGLLCDITILNLMQTLQMTSDEMFTRHANLE